MFEVVITNPENSWCDEDATHLNKVHFVLFDSKICTVSQSRMIIILLLLLFFLIIERYHTKLVCSV